MLLFRDGRFDERDAQLVAALTEPLGAALRFAHARLEEPPAEPAGGVAVLGAQGVEAADEAATRLLDSLGEPPLPAVVDILAARARVALVIRTERSRDLIAAILGLTAREREVVGLVVAGRSTGEIAAALHLSEWTVQDHLKGDLREGGRAQPASAPRTAGALSAPATYRAARAASASC